MSGVRYAIHPFREEPEAKLNQSHSTILLRWDICHMCHIPLAKINHIAMPNINGTEKWNPTTRWRRGIFPNNHKTCQSHAQLLFKYLFMPPHLLGMVFLDLLLPNSLNFQGSIQIKQLPKSFLNVFCQLFFHFLYSSVHLYLSPVLA